MGPGDILVFLSGEREIRDTAEALGRLDLPRHRAAAAVRAAVRRRAAPRVRAPPWPAGGAGHQRGRDVAHGPRDHRRGRPRAPPASPATTAAPRCSACPIEAISQASAAQRAGRCGRVAPGHLHPPLLRGGLRRPRPSSPSPRSCARTWRRSSCRWPPSGWATSPPSRSSSRPMPARIKDGHPPPRGAGGARPGRDRATTCASPRSAAGWRGSPPTPGWPAWCWRPIGTAWWARCSCWRRRCRSRTRGSGRPDERAGGPASSTSASPTPSPTSSATSTCGATCASSRRRAGRASSARCARPSTSTTCASASGRTCTASSARSPAGIGLEVRPLADEPDRDGDPPRAARRACCPTSACSTPTATSTAAPGRPASCSRPGTALGKRRPKWVMAAELVETNRLRARTVAQITPDRIEQAAGHLVTRSHEEPWWEEARGAAMTTERVSLYGLPLVTGRRVQLDRVDPAEARAMFLRHALVDGDWDGRHAFVQANKEQVADVVALEERVRRDLLVSDEALVAFFDARVPADVTTARRFDRWWKGAARDAARPAHLHAGRSRRARRRSARPGGVPRLGGAGARRASPLTYVLDPASDLDGVVVDVPLPLLDRVGDGRPRLAGARPPARARHRAAAHAAEGRCAATTPRRPMSPPSCSPTVGPDDGPLLDVLAARPVPPRRACRWPPHHLDLGAVPPHLRVTYRAVDDAGRPLAWSKDLAGAAPPPAPSGCARRWRRPRPVDEVSGATAWVFGDDPAHRRPSPTPGSPSPAIRRWSTRASRWASACCRREAEQRTAMWGGTRRLLLLPARLAAAHARPGPAQRHQAGPRRARPASAPPRPTASARRRRSTSCSWSTAGRCGTPTPSGRCSATVRAGFAAGRRVIGAPGGRDPGQRRAASRPPWPTMLTAAHDDIGARRPAPTSTGSSTGAGSARPASIGCPTWPATCGPWSTGSTRRAPSPIEIAATSPASRRWSGTTGAVASRDVDGRVRAMLEELRVSTFAQSVGAKGGVERAQGARRHRHPLRRDASTHPVPSVHRSRSGRLAASTAGAG